VLAADLDLLGQLRPGQRIRFVEVTLNGVAGW
jgi:allophanate hydrolase subunit 2